MSAVNVLADPAHGGAGFGSYTGDIAAPGVGGTLPDLFRMEFYQDSLQWNNGPGTYDLGNGLNTNYYTCAQCVRVFEDYDTTTGTITKTYMQVQGSMTITSIASPLDANKSSGTIKDLKLVEVYFDKATSSTIPVSGGGCIIIPSMSWNVK